MAVATELQKVSVALMLGDGNNSDGTPKRIRTSFGQLNPDTADNDKLMAVVNKLRPLISKSIVHLERSDVTKVG